MYKDFTKYEIYEDGRIWSYSRKKFLKPTTKNGYQVVCLYDNEGNMKQYLLHRVVWESVTGSPIPEGLQVNHKDENKANNNISNLNLMTPKENSNWGTGIQRQSQARINGKRSKQVGSFNRNGELVMVFPSTRECGRNGFDQGNVAACCRGEKKTYKGYEWRYL